MRIGGLQKLTLIDYPGKVAAIIFTQGCNLRCGYCYNSGLVLERPAITISEKSVLEFLAQRRRLLQGVVISGGEPTLHADLPEFIGTIKDLGLAVKLDTNGTQPEALVDLIQKRRVDYIAMDIKTSLEKYDRITGISGSAQNIRRSIDLIKHSGIDFEFRTTLLKPFCTPDDIAKIKNLIGTETRYRLQQFQPLNNIIDPSLLKAEHYSEEEVNQFKTEMIS